MWGMVPSFSRWTGRKAFLLAVCAQGARLLVLPTGKVSRLGRGDVCGSGLQPARWRFAQVTSDRRAALCDAGTYLLCCLLLCDELVVGRIRHSTLRGSLGLDLTEPAHCLLTVFAAHFGARLERGADRRPRRVAKNLAPLLFVELQTSHARWFPSGHSRDGT